MSETINPMDQVIEDAVNDSVLPDAPVEAAEESTELSADQVPSPGADPVEEAVDPLADPSAPVQDDFEKKWGIPARSVTGRENRIPHARVKNMVTKAEQEGYAKAVKELEGKSGPQLQEFTAKVKDYEGRLEKVAQFEQVLENDPKTFLSLLSQIPAYKEFFDYVGQLASKSEAAAPKTPEGMPQPDQTLQDGTKVYSMEGLQSLLQWQSENVEKRVTQQVEGRLAQRYQPMEQEWQSQHRLQQLVPVIEKQIADARTWPNFAELEPEIVKILKTDPQISLERAYVKAYQEIQVPKVSADRNKIRTEILQELRQKPVASSAPSSQVRPGSTQATNRSMDQVIADALKDQGLL